MPKYVAIINTPGHLPESEPAEFDTAREAWDYLADERKRAEDSAEDWPVGNPYEYTETHDVLTRIAGQEPIGPMLWDGDPVTNADGTGTVYGNSPGYFGDHDLGKAYSVQLAETGGDSTPRERAGITITCEQIEEWVGRPVSDEIIERLYEAIPWSSIPDAINVIVTDGIDPDGGNNDD